MCINHYCGMVLNMMMMVIDENDFENNEVYTVDYDFNINFDLEEVF